MFWNNEEFSLCVEDRTESTSESFIRFLTDLYKKTCNTAWQNFNCLLTQSDKTLFVVKETACGQTSKAFVNAFYVNILHHTAWNSNINVQKSTCDNLCL